MMGRRPHNEVPRESPGPLTLRSGRLYGSAFRTTESDADADADANADAVAEPHPDAEPDRPSPEPTFDDHWTNTTPSDRGPGDLVQVVLRDGKNAHRLTVGQLRASIPALFGGITWTNGSRTNPVVMFNTLSRTLGEADYVSVTQESTSPNPIFAKFMDDMAGQVCKLAVAADVAATGSTPKQVIPYATEVDRNLRFLRLKLHGIHVPDASMEGLSELRQLYNDILADTHDANQAWTGVCIAMLTAPEFMAY